MSDLTKYIKDELLSHGADLIGAGDLKVSISLLEAGTLTFARKRA